MSMEIRCIGRALAVAVVVMFAPWSPAPADSAEPSFDCNRASGEVEELVCADDALAELDRQMAEVYAAAMKSWPAEEFALQKMLQRGWIKGRNDCWKADDVRVCVESSYRERIVRLQIQSGQVEAPTVVGYTCTGHEGTPFSAAFYRQTDPPSAVLTFGDNQVIAFVAPSGSGARYLAESVEFWEHQGEATVDWFGTELICIPR